jgi:hypothetical protein
MRLAFLLTLLLSGAALAETDLWQRPPAGADHALLREVSARLAGETELARHFVQEKQLKILKRPIRTEGTMLYREGQGVCWHTEQPVTSTLVLGEQQLRQLGDDGADPMVITAEQQPALFGFTRLFFSLLAGRVQGAAEQFELRIAGDAAAWQLGLVPRGALLQRFIARMQLDGGEQLDRVTVTDPGGDRTVITFTPFEGAADELERRCFE